MRKGSACNEFLLVIVVVGLLASLAAPLCRGSLRRARSTACASNLSQLWKLQNVYISQFGSRPKLMPQKHGKDFWLHLSLGNPPLIDEETWDVYSCPVRGRPVPGTTDYLGPPQYVQRLGDSDPVGSDDWDNHSEDGSRGGNLLRKAGDIVEMTGDEWEALLKARRAIP